MVLVDATIAMEVDFRIRDWKMRDATETENPGVKEIEEKRGKNIDKLRRCWNLGFLRIG